MALLLLALAGLSLNRQQTTDQPFTTPLQLADTTRLALTPKIDGVIDAEEWDPFVSADGADTFLQWEPGKIYLAAKAPINDEIVYSFDLKNNGWLVGRDNLEVRLRHTEAGVQVKGRVLDADNKNGPKWVDVPGISIASQAVSKVSDDGSTWTVEVVLNDPGTNYFPDGPGRIGARVDIIPMDATEVPAYVPRAVAQVKFGLKRATGLPGGVLMEPQGEGMFVGPGRGMDLRFTFKGDNASSFQRVAMRSEGFSKDATNAIEVPFPKLDKKGRAFVDYETKIADGASVGYRVARCVVTSSDGATAMGQASYRIAPPIDIELVPVSTDQKAHSSLVKVTIYLRSNSVDKFQGVLHMDTPSGFSVMTGNDKPFTLYKTQTVRRVMEMSIPPNAVGTYPFTMTAKVGSQEFTQTGYLTIQY